VTDAKTVVTLTGNRCLENNHSGIMFIEGAGGEVKDNQCSENLWSGIAVRGAGTEPVLTANRCDDNGAWGIVSWAGAKPTIAEDNVTYANWVGGVKRRN
jgi:parallel beta-helix repeat protein